MSRPHGWSYVQARLQARHGDRLDEAAWRTLQGARSVDQFLERSRHTSLHRFTDLIEARMSSHAVERILRAAWRDYVAELGRWAMPVWRPAVLWAGHFPDLPALDALFKGPSPGWAREDPLFAPFARAHSQQQVVDPGASPLARLSPAADTLGALGVQWLAQWQTLWPRLPDSDRHGLDSLIAVVVNYFESLARAGSEDSSAPYRQDLQRKATRIFRKFAGTPAALFSHLILVALDLERLRGGVIRRRLFDTANLGHAS